MITPLLPSKPSISVSSWFRVCSRSSLPPLMPAALSRLLPMVSISSMNTMQGAFSAACLNRSRTRAAPMPTNISTNSEPAMLKKGTPASPATALASRVLPVPGGPTSRAPLGRVAPMLLYLLGLCRKSTISARASLASSCPATSAKVLPVWASTYTLALDLPKLMALGPPIRFIIKRMSSWPSSTMNSTGSTTLNKRFMMGEVLVGITPPYSTSPPSGFLASSSRSTRSGSLTHAV